MGCDIHMRVEREKHAGEWRPFAYFPSGLARQYEVFGYLAGVRGDGPPIAELRGLPEVQYLDGGSYIGEHSFTWLTPEEFAAALSSPMEHGPEPEYRAILALMRAMAESGEPVRIVMGFDS